MHYAINGRRNNAEVAKIDGKSTDPLEFVARVEAGVSALTYFPSLTPVAFPPKTIPPPVS